MKKIGKNIWESEYKAKIMPGVYFPVRASVVQLANGDGLVISPGPETAKQLEKLEPQFERIFVVSPNAMHYAHVEAFLTAFPKAEYFCPHATLKKVPSIAQHAKPIEELAKLIGNDFELVSIAGNKFLSETVFYHKESASLIATDLCFNMKGKMNTLTSVLLKTVGAYARIGQSLLVKVSTRDKKAYSESIAKLQKLPITQVIVGHGNIITQEELGNFWSAVRTA